MRGLAHTVCVLRLLRATGEQVAIDDFGTGYAGLAFARAMGQASTCQLMWAACG